MNNSYIMKGLIAAGILTIILVLLILLLRPLFKQPEYTKPTGPYPVGTHHWEIKDPDRLENDTSRRISVRFFYPAAEEKGERFPAMDSDISEAFSKLYRIPMGGGDTAESFSFIDAPPLKKGGPFPVVIFSHGGFSFDTQNLSTLEELASRGYIVAAISHTGEAILTKFPDGTSLPMADSSYMKESMSMGREQAVSYREAIEKLKSEIPLESKKKIYAELGATTYSGLESYLRTRIMDIHLLLAQLERLQSSADFPLNGLMDLDKTGMFGHSFGGITTAYICSEENTPVRSGINLDAPIITYNNNSPELKRPFALFYSTQTSIPRSGSMDLTGCNNYYAQTSKERVYSLSVKGTAHYNYSDFNFMPPIVRLTPMLGTIEGQKMSKIMNHTVADFFDMTLKGSKDTLFTGKTLPYPELTLSDGKIYQGND